MKKLFLNIVIIVVIVPLIESSCPGQCLDSCCLIAPRMLAPTLVVLNFYLVIACVCATCSVMSDSLRLHGL